MFDFIGLKTPVKKQIVVLVIFVAVSVGLATAYKLSGNHLIVAYFVNLPNAFVTYMLKFPQFPAMEISSTIASIITLFLIIVIFIIHEASAKS